MCNVAYKVEQEEYVNYVKDHRYLSRIVVFRNLVDAWDYVENRYYELLKHLDPEKDGTIIRIDFDGVYVSETKLDKFTVYSIKPILFVD